MHWSTRDYLPYSGEIRRLPINCAKGASAVVSARDKVLALNAVISTALLNEESVIGQPRTNAVLLLALGKLFHKKPGNSTPPLKGHRQLDPRDNIVWPSRAWLCLTIRRRAFHSIHPRVHQIVQVACVYSCAAWMILTSSCHLASPKPHVQVARECLPTKSDAYENEARLNACMAGFVLTGGRKKMHYGSCAVQDLQRVTSAGLNR